MEPSPAPGAASALGEDHYTVVLAGGGHRTLEVTRAGPDFRAGPLVVSYLCGPDNERDYRSFAHITTEGAGRLWHRFRQDSAWSPPWWRRFLGRCRRAAQLPPTSPRARPAARTSSTNGSPTSCHGPPSTTRSPSRC